VPTNEDIPRLEYTDMVLSESMRLYPPAWAMGREVLEDVAIGPYRLRKGTMVFFSQYIVHRDPRWFHTLNGSCRSDLRWRPRQRGRGLPTSPSAAEDASASASPFAWMEAILALATIAQRWRLALVPGQTIEPQPKITLRPKDGIRMVLVPRT